MEYPLDSLDLHVLVGNNGTSTILSVPTGTAVTILQNTISSSAGGTGGNILISCGDTTISKVWNLQSVNWDNFTQNVCTEDITAVRTGFSGNPEFSIGVVYVPREINATSSVTSTSNGTYIVGVLLVIALVSIIDLVRRLFARKRN